MGLIDIFLTGAILFFAAMAQGAVGFGYALFATPLLLWLGMPLPNAITLVTTSTLIQSSIGAAQLRNFVPWRISIVATAVRIVFAVVGILILARIQLLDRAQIRLVIGCILCALVLIQLLWRPQPVSSMHWAWGGFAFITSGILQGISGMGGPPLVIWSMAHNWTTQKTRGFLFTVFALGVPFQILLLCTAFGAGILKSVAVGIAFLPLVYLGSILGLPVGNRMPKAKLRFIAYMVLLGVGISAVMPAVTVALR